MSGKKKDLALSQSSSLPASDEDHGFFGCADDWIDFMSSHGKERPPLTDYPENVRSSLGGNAEIVLTRNNGILLCQNLESLIRSGKLDIDEQTALNHRLYELLTKASEK